jgi:hypothetical protein
VDRDGGDVGRESREKQRKMCAGGDGSTINNGVRSGSPVLVCPGTSGHRPMRVVGWLHATAAMRSGFSLCRGRCGLYVLCRQIREYKKTSVFSRGGHEDDTISHSFLVSICPRVPKMSFPFPRFSPLPFLPSPSAAGAKQARLTRPSQRLSEGWKPFLLQPPPALSVLLLPPWASGQRNVPCVSVSSHVSSLRSYVSCLIPHVSVILPSLTSTSDLRLPESQPLPTDSKGPVRTLPYTSSRHIDDRSPDLQRILISSPVDPSRIPFLNREEDKKYLPLCRMLLYVLPSYRTRAIRLPSLPYPVYIPSLVSEMPCREAH